MEAECGEIIISRPDVNYNEVSSARCPLLVSAQTPPGRWVEWPEISLLAFLCSF